MKKKLSLIGLVVVLVMALAMPVFAATEENNGGAGGSVLPPQNPSGNNLAPNIIVSRSSFGGDNVIAGKTFTLSYTLTNTSKYSSVQNVVVKVNGGEVFALNEGADTSYIEKISAKGAISRNIELVSSAETLDGSYPISLGVAFEYYDSGVKYTGTSEINIAIPVAQDDRVNITKASIGADGEPVIKDEEYAVDYEFLNSGFSKLLNTELHLINAEDGSSIDYAYLGTVNPSTQMSGSSYLHANFGSTGKKNLKLLVTYEDTHLNRKTAEFPFSVTVEDAPVMTEEEMNAEADGGGSAFLWVGFAVIGLIVLTVVIILLKKRKKKKKALEEASWDEDDDDLEEEDTTDIEDDQEKPSEGIDKNEDK